MRLLNRPLTIYANSVKLCEYQQPYKSVVCIFHKARITGNTLQPRKSWKHFVALRLCVESWGSERKIELKGDKFRR